MISFFFLNIIACLVLVTAAPASAAPAPAAPAEGLLKGKVLTVVGGGNQYQITVQVEHVYCDGGQNVGPVFEFTEYLNDHTGSTQIYPPLRAGEEGLWAVERPLNKYSFPHTWTPQERDMWNDFSGGYGFLSPARPGLDPRYLQTLGLADLVEQMCHAAPTRQARLLIAAVKGDNTTARRWALGILRISFPDDFLTLAHSLLGRRDLPLEKQMDVSAQLSQVPGSDWPRSPARLALYGQWAQADLSHIGAVGAGRAMGDQVLEAFLYASRYEGLSEADYLSLLQAAAANPHWPDASRRWAQRLIQQEKASPK